MKMVHLHRDLLSRCFVIDFTENPDENPLYNATNLCADELNQCVDKVTNLNELPKLLVASKYPFVKLTRKANVATILSKAREPLCNISEEVSTTVRSTSLSRDEGGDAVGRSPLPSKHDASDIGDTRNSSNGENDFVKRRRTSPGSVTDFSRSPINEQK